MKALITGVGGFVGGHLARYLLAQEDVEVIGTTYFPADQHSELSQAGANLQQLDLRDQAAVHKLLENIKPDQIYHLAAQSFVPESFENPWGTLSNNIQAQINLLHSMINLALDARILVVGSAEVYGKVAPEEVPLDESQPLRPTSPYGVSKVTQDMLGLQYNISHDVAAIRVRPFNQIGPGQNERFVAPDFASQIAAIEQGQQEPVVYVGNLEARKDFVDVRDMISAYWLTMKLGEPGEVYNIGAGEAHSIQELLDILVDLSDKPITIKTDPLRMRPVEVPIFVSDSSKIRAVTGWETTYTFKQTLLDVLNDWRERVKKST